MANPQANGRFGHPNPAVPNVKVVVIPVNVAEDKSAPKDSSRCLWPVVGGIVAALILIVSLVIIMSPPDYSATRNTIRGRVAKEIAAVDDREQSSRFPKEEIAKEEEAKVNQEMKARFARMGDALKKAVDVLEADVESNGKPNKVTVLQYFDAGYTRQILGGFLTLVMPWTLLFSNNGMMTKYAGLYHESGSIKQCLTFLAQMELGDTHGVQVLVYRDGSPTSLLSGSGKTIGEILAGGSVRHGVEPRDSDSAETRARRLGKRREQQLYYDLDGSIVLPKPENV
jgi:hypothetical protein